jgi:hypothetical protein
MAARASTKGRHQTPTRRIVQGLLSLVLVVAIFWFVFKGIDVAQVRALLGLVAIMREGHVALLRF